MRATGSGRVASFIPASPVRVLVLAHGFPWPDGSKSDGDLARYAEAAVKRWTAFAEAYRVLKPGGRLVANAVSLETEARLAGCFRDFGGDLIRLQVARADRVGTMSGWRPAMPVTQWRVRKP